MLRHQHADPDEETGEEYKPEHVNLQCHTSW
jgi:hypothetical protein